MSDSAATSEARVPLLSQPLTELRDLAARLAKDRVTVALVLLLVVAWLIEGVRSLAGVSHNVVGVIDVAEAAVCVWLAIPLVKARQFRVLAVLAAYAAWILSGLIYTGAGSGSVVTAVKDSLLLPLLAVLVAMRGATEQRTRVIACTLFLLGVFELLLTIVQALLVPAGRSPDWIVGTFGASGNAALGVAVLLTVCVGISGYLAGARYGELGLVGAFVLPLFSAWVVVKVVTLLVPLVAVVLVIPALAMRRVRWRQALIAVGVATLSSGLVVGTYAVFKPDSFEAITSLTGLETYAANGSLSGASSLARLHHTIVANYGNAKLLASPLPYRGGALRIGNLVGGGYSVWLLDTPKLQPNHGTGWFTVRPHQMYTFTADVAGGVKLSQTVEAQILWINTHGHRVLKNHGRGIVVNGQGTSMTSVGVGGTAPPSASYAIPRLSVIGKPPSGSVIYASSLGFAHAQPYAAVAGGAFGSLFNASVLGLTFPGREGKGFRVRNVTGGNYYVRFIDVGRRLQPANHGTGWFGVRRNHSYRFRAYVRSAAAFGQTISAQVEWLSPHGKRASTITGKPVSIKGLNQGWVWVAAQGVAPSWATRVVPKLVVTSAPPARAGFYARQLHVQSLGRVTAAVRATPAAPVATPAPVRHHAAAHHAAARAPVRVSPKVQQLLRRDAPLAVRPVRHHAAAHHAHASPRVLPSPKVRQLLLREAPLAVRHVRHHAGAHHAAARARVLPSPKVRQLLRRDAPLAVRPVRHHAAAHHAAASARVLPSPKVRQLLRREAPAAKPAHQPKRPSQSQPSRSAAATRRQPWPKLRQLLSEAPAAKPTRQPKQSSQSQSSRSAAPGTNSVPGHWTLLRTAAGGISGSVTSAAFGKGVGSATVAQGLSGRPRGLSRSASFASYSDAGTVLYERGWFGLLVVLALGIAFIVIAIRLARRLPSGRWTTAFTLAVPGVVVVMGIYAVLGTLLQNRAVSLTFWLIVALGLSAAIPTVGQSDRRKPRSNQAPGARLGGW